MKVTVLGCGSSTGVPMIGCTCKICTSTNPKNKRSRVSVLVEISEKNILIDSSPDLRQQALTNGINKIDAVLYTHDHADHTHGIDDLRSFNYLSDKSIPVYCDRATYNSISSRFSYAFQEKPDVWYRPSLTANILPDFDKGELKILDIPIIYFRQKHGLSETIGYRFDNFAYSTDTDGLSDSALEALAGVEVWLVDCLRYGKSPTHANLEMTLGWIEKIKPKKAILTHMTHEFDYDALLKDLPAGVIPGYDGMQIEL